MLIYVDLSRQIAVVYRNGVRIAETTVSTGKPGYVTPTGVFTILQKDMHPPGGGRPRRFGDLDESTLLSFRLAWALRLETFPAGSVRFVEGDQGTT